MRPRQKIFNFDEEMKKDLDIIKRQFKDKFGVLPSNSSIMDLLLQTYKHSKIDIKRKPKSKKKFIIQM